MARQFAILVGLGLAVYAAFASSRPVVTSDLLFDRTSEARPLAKGGLIHPRGGDYALPAGGAGGSQLVRVDFYGESLCPDCQHMVQDVLQPMFDNGIAKLMALRYIGFGNVHNSSSGYACQHGPEECKYNRYINCAQKLHPGAWWPYIKCLADNMHSLGSKADACAAQQGWDAGTVATCAAGAEGKALEDTAAAETWTLHPKHTSVPWIVVNGVAIASDFKNLDRYVCAASPAARRPAACFELPDRLAGSIG